MPAAFCGTSFSAYLWGIETLLPSLRIMASPLFSAYLWGIETKYPDRCSHCLAPIVFSLPMRNWNESAALVTSKAYLFSAYLWGIETTLLDRHSDPAQRVFSLPMRNWNCSEYIAAQGGEAGFQPTYEELKRIFVPIKKHSCKRFQPTYEELKQKYNERVVQEHVGVFSLPMRNWNFISQAVAISPDEFSAYLWGVETMLFLIRPPTFVLAFSLPIRNWNDPDA